jgi:hypothetical protein
VRFRGGRSRRYTLEASERFRYALEPGMAYVYNEGNLSARREGSTKLIRIEGTNMDKVKRLAYERM